MENPDLVPHTNVLQFAIKNYREITKKGPAGKKDKNDKKEKNGGCNVDDKPPTEPITMAPGGDMGHNTKID